VSEELPPREGEGPKWLPWEMRRKKRPSGKKVPDQLHPTSADGESLRQDQVQGGSAQEWWV